MEWEVEVVKRKGGGGRKQEAGKKKKEVEGRERGRMLRGGMKMGFEWVWEGRGDKGVGGREIERRN